MALTVRLSGHQRSWLNAGKPIFNGDAAAFRNSSGEGNFRIIGIAICKDGYGIACFQTDFPNQLAIARKGDVYRLACIGFYPELYVDIFCLIILILYFQFYGIIKIRNHLFMVGFTSGKANQEYPRNAS